MALCGGWILITVQIPLTKAGPLSFAPRHTRLPPIKAGKKRAGVCTDPSPPTTPCSYLYLACSRSLVNGLVARRCNRGPVDMELAA
jgi:hypothetical protein